MQARKTATIVSLVITLILLLAASYTTAGPPVEQREPGALEPASTTFTYQSRLTDEDTPANGSYDFQFELYKAAEGVVQVGSTVTLDDVPVTNGLFSVELDFGSDAFTGEARWLEIGVREGTSDGAYTTLTPRHALTAVPYALYALQAPWSGLADMPAGFADGVDDDTTYSAGTGLTLEATTFSANTTYLQRRVSDGCAAGNAIRVIDRDGTVTCEPDDDSGGDITRVNAGTGLTGGGESGEVSLNVSFAGSGTAATAARSNHDHWGDTWSGSGVGLTLNSSNDDGLRVSGGDNGVQIESAGNHGVYITSPAEHGVRVESAGDVGFSVDGASGDGIIVSSAGRWGVYLWNPADDGIYVYSPGANGLEVYSPASHGVRVESPTFDGLNVQSAGRYGVRINSPSEHGVYVQGAADDGVYIDSAGADGFNAYSSGDDGVDVNSPNDDGVYIKSPGDDGVQIDSAGAHGVNVDGPTSDGVNVESAGNHGVYVQGATNDGFRVDSAGRHGFNSVAAGEDGVRVDHPSDNGVYVLSPGDDGVRVESAGQYGVYADTDDTYGFYTPDSMYVGGKIDLVGAVDPIIGERFKVDPRGQYEAGDLLVIDPDSPYLVLSTEPDDTKVIGVVGPGLDYSDGELMVIVFGWHGAKPAEDDTENTRSVAKIKADATYGPIKRGDLLTTSATPGHAMKAQPVSLGGIEIHRPGTIIGKALQSLDSGRGLIEVFVALQ